MANYRPPILQWQDISEFYRSGLIVGNGGSVAVDGNFSYSSLYQAAQDRNHLGGRVADVFRRFNTQDFELVLRRLWQATLVNQALDIEAGVVENAYTDVRDALIRTIRDTHVTYDRALPHLTPIYIFMQQFKTVISLNYDLVVYWAAMLGNQNLGVWFKDAFNGPVFDENWKRYRDPYRAAGATMLFYPHGNLALARVANGNEVKVAAQNNQELLATITNRWETGHIVPLFVCEGTSDQKRRAISSSNYLSTVLYEPMRDLGESIAIYGWGLGDQEAHILLAVKESRPNKIAVSVHENNREFVNRALYLLNPIADQIEFFDADSLGCWNKPAQ